jgi:hypothetical protein
MTKLLENKALKQMFIYILEKASNEHIPIDRYYIMSFLKLKKSTYYDLKKNIIEELGEGNWIYNYVYNRVKGYL